MTEQQNPGKRARNRAEIQASLLRTARSHLASHGAAGLSLRAVARDMGMAPSALFRYTANRDELLTLLIVTAYDELGERVETAERAVRRSDTAGRWAAVAGALRAWALRNPHDYALLYGSPVPDYAAPGETTNTPGTRVLRLVAGIIRDSGPAVGDPGAEGTGSAESAPAPPPPADPITARYAAAGISALRQDPDISGLDPQRVVRGLAAWNLLIGAVSSEVFGHLGPGAGDMDALFECTVALSGGLFLPDPTTGA